MKRRLLLKNNNGGLSGVLIASGAILVFYFFTDLKVSSPYFAAVLFGMWGYGLYCDLKSTFRIPQMIHCESHSWLRMLSQRYGARKAMTMQIGVEVTVVCAMPMLFERTLFLDYLSVAVVAAVVGMVHLDCAASNNSFVKAHYSENILAGTNNTKKK